MIVVHKILTIESVLSFLVLWLLHNKISVRARVLKWNEEILVTAFVTCAKEYGGYSALRDNMLKTLECNGIDHIPATIWDATTLARGGGGGVPKQNGTQLGSSKTGPTLGIGYA